MPGNSSYLEYLWKAFKLFIINFIFGLFPLVIVWFVSLGANGFGQEEVEHLIQDGVIIFVSIATMGAVMVDFLLASRSYTGLQIFALVVFPLFIMGVVAIEYLLVFTDKLDKSCFDVFSPSTIIIFSFSFIYSIFAKANFYMQEDLHNKS